jgi:tripartite-type tricarboxylate transporter receptor subunit TctC
VKIARRQADKRQHQLCFYTYDRRQRSISPSGQHSRRRFLALTAGAATLPTLARRSSAQTAYPTRPITMIVPQAAGGPTDGIGRLAAERMRRSLGQPVLIENIVGANGSIAIGRAAHARPDGYTIALGLLPTHVLNGAYYSLQYDVVNDFAPIAPLVSSPLVLCAGKSMPAANLKELIAWLKSNPNKASVAVSVVSHRLLAALFMKETDTQFLPVPYRGLAPAMQDLVAGHVDLAFAGTDSFSLLRTGNIKSYAVTGDARLMAAPDIPTFAEKGLPALSYSGWFGLFAPKGTPRDIIDKLNMAVVEAMAEPAARSRFADLGMEIFPPERQTPEALAAMQKADAEKWWPLIREFRLKGE